MYITQNNGGLSIDNHTAIHGTDVAHYYSNSLRGYAKEQVNFGSNTKGGITTRFADRFIHSKLAPEDADFSKKNAKELARLNLRKQLKSLEASEAVESQRDKTQSEITARLSVKTDTFKFARPSETESKHLFRSNVDQLQMVKEMLKMAPISKHDIYFRN